MRIRKSEETIIKSFDVSIDKIDWEDKFFRISTECLPGNIIRSIAAIGLINEPYIIGKEGGYSIVSGFRRFAACRQLEFEYVRAKLFDESTSLKQCAAFAIADNSCQRQLNLIEQSRSYALLNQVCEDKRAFDELLFHCGLSTNTNWIAKILPLCKLPESIQRGIEADAIPVATAQLLSDLEEKAAIFISDLFQNFSLGLNKQREIILLASEIAKRDSLTLWDVMHHEDISEIIADKNLDKNSKTSKIRQWLKHKRFPNLSEKINTFESRIKTLKLGNRVKLTPPPYFEGQQFKLDLNFSNIDELSSLKDIIALLENDAYLRSLLD